MTRESCIGLVCNLASCYDNDKANRMIDFLLDIGIINEQYEIDYNKITDDIWKEALTK